MIVPRVLRRATLSLLSFVGTASGYDIETHRELGLRGASSSSNVRSVLGDDLGFDRGTKTLFLGQIADEWIQADAGFEDIPFFHVVNHFHNSLNPWSASTWSCTRCASTPTATSSGTVRTRPGWATTSSPKPRCGCSTTTRNSDSNQMEAAMLTTRRTSRC